MNMASVTRGVASKEYFTDIVLKDTLMMSWVITPPTDFTIVQTDILHSSLDVLSTIVARGVPNIVTTKTKPDGTTEVTTRIDTKALAEVLKIATHMMDRVQGAVVQRAHVLQHNTGGPALPAKPAVHGADDVDKLNRQLEDIKRKLGNSSGQAAEIVEGD